MTTWLDIQITIGSVLGTAIIIAADTFWDRWRP